MEAASSRLLVIYIILAFLVVCDRMSNVKAECPNACKGRGKCLANDMCFCYKGYTEGDCSGRICPFGRSFVDIPLGDLDNSNSLSGARTIVAQNNQIYPQGTTEKYPNMVDSDNVVLKNTAHPYVECSNKGQCERGTGTCKCLIGYEGRACDKTSCPNVNGKICNNRGTCDSAKDIAADTDGNEYKLWDAESTQACTCDPGYYGAACDRKRCKYDYDPLYYDRHNSPRYSNWSIIIATDSNTSYIFGNYSIHFFDSYGEDWYTEPIGFNASCYEIIYRLEQLPNRVITPGTVRCLKWDNFEFIDDFDDPIALQIRLRKMAPYFGVKYTLAFPRNPGDLKQIQINKYLDGNRPTLYVLPTTNKLSTFIYPNGFHGEYVDNFEYCAGVDVVLKSTTSYFYFDDLTFLETRLLQKCLGDADTLYNVNSATSKSEGVFFNWDYGTKYNPHIVKLVDQSSIVITDLCNSSISGRIKRNSGRACQITDPPGFFAVGYYSPALDRFIFWNRAMQDYSTSTKFSVFTTRGTVQMASEDSEMFTEDGNPYSQTVYLTNSTSNFGINYRGELDCETQTTNINGVLMCIERGSSIFFMDNRLTPSAFLNNPKYFNLYKVARIYQASKSDFGDFYRNRIVLDKSINFHIPRGEMMRAYIFTPPTDPGGYEYVAECSNRGNCEDVSGICQCFEGFKGPACNMQYNVIS